MNRGFTLIEMIICLAIFVVITSVVMAKFGNYNRENQVRDTAYDMALTMRQAQTYGLSVRNAGQAGVTDFSKPFGLAFSSSSSYPCGVSAPSPTTGFSMFVDSDPVGSPNGICTSIDQDIRFFRYLHASQQLVCAGSGPTTCSTVDNLSVSFKRPDPDATICTQASGTASCGYGYAEIRLVGADMSTSTVVVRKTGQISVRR